MTYEAPQPPVKKQGALPFTLLSALDHILIFFLRWFTYWLTYVHAQVVAEEINLLRKDLMELFNFTYVGTL